MAKPRRGKCAVIAQAVLAGSQVLSTRAFHREDGWTTPYISVRVGNVLLVIEDREALTCLNEAVRAANHLADKAFGPVPRLGNDRTAPQRQP